MTSCTPTPQGHGTEERDSSEGGPEFAEVFVIVWVGALVVTLNTKLLHVLEGVGFIQLATLHLKVLVNQIEADPAKQSAMSKEVSNVMFQVRSN